MSSTTSISPFNIVSQFGYILEDYLLASVIAGSIDWIFSSIPFNQNGILTTLLAILQLSLAFAFTIGCKSYVNKWTLIDGSSIFLPIFVWHWSPRSIVHLAKGYRMIQKFVLGSTSAVENKSD